MSIMVVVFTDAYPYTEWEAPFIHSELEILQQKYDKVVLVPLNRYGNAEFFATPFEVDISLSALYEKEVTNIYKRIYKEVKVCADLLFYLDILRRPDILLDMPLFKTLKHALVVAHCMEQWLQEKDVQNYFNLDTIVLYTLWCTPLTLGAGRFSKERETFFVISRALGYDMYDEQNLKGYIPLQPWTLSSLDALFPCSQAGCDYLSLKYPELKDKFYVSRLGTSDVSVCVPNSHDGKIRLLSCSRVSPEKRLDLLFHGIKAFALKYPSYHVE